MKSITKRSTSSALLFVALLGISGCGSDVQASEPATDAPGATAVLAPVDLTIDQLDNVLLDSADLNGSFEEIESPSESGAEEPVTGCAVFDGKDRDDSLPSSTVLLVSTEVGKVVAQVITAHGSAAESTFAAQGAAIKECASIPLETAGRSLVLDQVSIELPQYGDESHTARFTTLVNDHTFNVDFMDIRVGTTIIEIMVTSGGPTGGFDSGAGSVAYLGEVAGIATAKVMTAA